VVGDLNIYFLELFQSGQAVGAQGIIALKLSSYNSGTGRAKGEISDSAGLYHNIGRGLEGKKIFPDDEDGEELSASGLFGRKSQIYQGLNQGLAMIALDFDNVVFDGAARAAHLFELLGQFFQCCFVKLHPGNEADGASFAPSGLPADPHHAITPGGDFPPGAAALEQRLTAAGAGSPRFG